jgi:hypothetical protein
MKRLVSLQVVAILASLLQLSFPAIAVAQYAGFKPVPNDLKPGFDSITPAQAREWLGVLAGPAFAGRGTGQPGFMKAAHWVSGKAAEFGLEPMGEGGTYFQMMPLTQATAETKKSKLTIGDSLTIEATGSLGFERFVGQPLVEGKLAFVRLGADSPPLPEDAPLGDRVVFYYADDANAFRAATAIAAKRPAAALRIVESVPGSSSQSTLVGGKTRATSLSGTISKAAALQIIKSVGGDERWFDFADKTRKQIVTVDKAAKIEIRIHEEEAAYPNVCAWIEGSDANLRDEYVVLGAHLDHLGSRGGATYFGADDNGSGSTAVLSIARALALNPMKPKRSVLIMWFTGEEMGLLGSGYYCDHPILPLERMVCMFNIDMVGRNEERDGEKPSENVQTIHLIGSKQGNPDLHDVIMQANQHINFDFEYDEESVFGRSDQANFFNKAHTSVAFLFGGFHPDYHQPTDQPDKINYDKIAAAARLYYLAIHLAAQHGPFPIPSQPPASK